MICGHCGHDRDHHCGCGCKCMHVTDEEMERVKNAQAAIGDRPLTLEDLKEMSMRIDCLDCPGFVPLH